MNNSEEIKEGQESYDDLVGNVYRLKHRMWKPQAKVVRIKKKASGAVTQDCDVYIGPRVVNAHWNIEKPSKWVNDFGKTGLDTYKKHVLLDKTLLSELDSLRGKSLGCWCHPERCHGDVLVQLLNDHYGTRFKDNFANFASIHYFRGDMCPWSNLYPSPLKIDGRTFHCVQQYMTYKRAKKVQNNIAIELLMATENSWESVKIDRDYFFQKKIPFSLTQSVNMMETALTIKYRQCASFREMCQEHCLCIPAEITRSNYWSVGKVAPDCNRHPDVDEMPGKNILGWLILKVYYKYSCDGDYAILNHFYDSLPECEAKKGLGFVLYRKSFYN
jgi:predicted NAD-dependent protein-ADP-ribosyltransferase YbiA (DUF1768 family)